MIRNHTFHMPLRAETSRYPMLKISIQVGITLCINTLEGGGGGGGICAKVVFLQGSTCTMDGFER